MAKYDVKFSCGHQETVVLFGKNTIRQLRIKRMEEVELCSACSEAKRQAERAEALKAAEEQAKKENLPKLLGSQKQVEWAMQIRSKIVNDFDAIIWEAIKYGKMNQEVLIDTLTNLLLTETSATYYIDNRDTINGTLYDATFESLKRKYYMTNDKKQEKIIKEESTIIPKNFNEKELVEIIEKDNKIYIKSPKDERLRQVVKSLGYRWGEGSRYRSVDIQRGSIEDRLAEVASQILALGFGVICTNQKARELAISGEFEPEHRRWITWDDKERKIKLFWEKNESMYLQLRKLPGSRYQDGGILVDISIHEELEDISNLADFRFTEEAREKIESYKNELEKIEKVEVTKAVNKKYKEGLSEILNTENEVLEDLIDED